MIQEKEILETLRARLASHLPSSWSIDEVPGPWKFDAEIRIRAPDGRARLLMVSVKGRVYPRQASRWANEARERLDPNESLLLAAPYLSSESRKALTHRGIGYFDLTGNVQLQLDEPGLFIATSGADRDPDPEPGKVRSLGGDKALAVLRVLCDFTPPLTVTEIARLASSTPAYVSKLLDKLGRDDLIEKSPRKPVIEVDWRGLIEARARDADLLESCVWRGFVPTTGRPQLFEALSKEARQGRRVALTGTTVAERITPVASARWLCYTDDIRGLSGSLGGMLRASSVVEGYMILIEPGDPVVFDRLWQDDGPPCVALTQAAIDCLSGPDRMPEQGLALLEWMQRHVDQWRQPLATEET